MGAFTDQYEQEDENTGKHSDYDLPAMEALSAEEQAPSPDGAASQGAVGASATAEGTSDGPAALGDEGPKDMLSIFNQTSYENKSDSADIVRDKLSPEGISPEGAFIKQLMNGGPQASARAAQFGIDLMPFADKLNPEGSYKKAGQAFGNVPTDEQAASGGPFKDVDQATAEHKGAIEGQREQNAADKEAQRQAIAAFLIEAGLRTIASARDGGEAIAEGALGTMEAQAGRKRQTEQDTIAQKQRERTERRQDEQDEAGKLRAQQETAAFEREQGNWEAEDAEARAEEERKGLVKIQDKDGKTHQVKIAEGIARDQDGKIIISDNDQLLSLAQQRIQRDNQTRRYDTARATIQKLIDGGSYSGDEQVQAIMDMTDKTEKRNAINDLAMERLELPEDEDAEDYETLNWE